MVGSSGFNIKALIAKSGFAAFQFREYRYFWLAAAFSNLGMWALIFGRLWLMHKLTESPLMVGLVTTSSLGPLLLFCVFGGVIADRANRLKLLRLTRAMFAALAVLTGVLIANDVIRPWHLIAISVATGMLLSFDIPSRSAMLPALVPREHLAGAIALYSIVFGGAAIVGPAFFAPLVNLWGLEGVFFIIGASYVLTVGVLMFMNPRIHDPKARLTAVLQGLIDGFRYTGRHRVIAGVIALGMVFGMFGMPFETLLPELADKIITGGVDTYGRLLLSAGVGGLVAMVAIAILGPRVHPGRFLVVSGIGFGLGILTLSHVTWFAGAALTIGLIGAFRLVFGTMGTTLIQSLAADQFRGRVMSIYMLSWGMTALGAPGMGALGQSRGVSFALGLGGLVVAVATVVVAMLTLRQVLARRVLATDSSSSTIVAG